MPPTFSQGKFTEFTVLEDAVGLGDASLRPVLARVDDRAAWRAGARADCVVAQDNSISTQPEEAREIFRIDIGSIHCPLEAENLL